MPNQPNPPNLPGSPRTDPTIMKWLQELSAYVLREFRRRNPPVASVLLASPNGSVYSVEVTDAGMLTTTLVSAPPP